MKKFLVVCVVLSIVLVGGCGSIPYIPTDLAGVASGAQSVAQATDTAEFKSSEILCSDGSDNNPLDMYYYVAKVMTPASPATKNQAEVIFVNNGEKKWSSFVVPSHKAAKAELTIGSLVFVAHGWQDYDEKKVSSTDYRQSGWVLGRVTSTDELFKNRVEVDGNKYHPGLVRVPEIPLE